MSDVKAVRGIVYASFQPDGLLGDLYVPATSAPPPVVIYLHGGGWRIGSRSDGADTRIEALAAHGLAVLSIDYRLADVATFPAQLHDVKAAVRWLRGSGAEYGVDPESIGIWGASAGAHLAAMTGLTAGNKEFEGEIGTHLDQSSAVQAVVAWFGPHDLLAAASRSWLEEILRPDSPEAGLLGVEGPAGVIAVPARARHASPISWVHPEAPPFLLTHGDRDTIVLPDSSRQLHDALVRAGADSTLVLIGGAGHEDRRFDGPAHLSMTAGFLLAALRKS